MQKCSGMALIIIFVAFLLIGCSQAAITEFTQTKNGIVAVFNMSPVSPTMMEPTILSLHLTDADSVPLEGAQVTYDLTMPGMSMPPNQPDALEINPGVYTADAAFTMSGDWRVAMTVFYNGETTTFIFDISIK